MSPYDPRVPDAARDVHVVTGAFGYSGRYIAARLLAAGRTVRTLTNSPRRPNPFGPAVAVHGYNFDNPDALVRSLEGAGVLDCGCTWRRGRRCAP